MQNNKIYEKIKMIVYHTSLIFERNFREYFWNLLVAIKSRKGTNANSRKNTLHTRNAIRVFNVTSPLETV